ncbi:MAG TPA: c-type cytochrome [Anaerolineales bacterium]|nr:c-type cytochrome [Anaerolineales bacterium]
MKFRIILLITLTSVLSACNMSLAEDVTPPPGYIPPTPIPTLVLVPPQMPSVANGERIFFEKCAACHGDTGLGDGAQGIQLGVTVPAFALTDVARPKSPLDWFTTVTRGNIERFMPPFASLNDQERWDVVAYITTLHTSEDEIEQGKELFDANCPNCSTEYFEDQANMAGLSTVALARIVRLGNEEIDAFGENLSDEEMWAVAEYLRSLTYSTAPLAQPTAVPSSQTPLPSDEPSGEGTPLGTEQAEVTEKATPGFGTVIGIIENKTGGDLPSDLVVTLRGYEHDFQNPNAGTQEIVTVDGTIADDGSYIFENVEMPEGRIFLIEVNFKGVDNTSDFLIVEAGQTSLNLPSLTVYDVTDDISQLTVDELDIFLSIDSEGSYELLGLYTFRNASETIVHVEMQDMQEIPFLKFPVGDVQGIGYEALQDSAPFISTANGFAMQPNEIPYGIISFSSVESGKEINISQPLILPVSVVRVLVPEGMEAEGSQLTPDVPEDIQGQVYQSYFASEMQAGDILNFTISGSPNTASVPTETTSPNSSLLIGAGGLGIALLLVGVWMYFRDKAAAENDFDDDDEDDEFESAEDVMDAIIALDDLHRSKKISEAAYQRRRAELKDILKEMV